MNRDSTRDELIELRDHHLAKARECENAIALLAEVAAMKRRADRILGKVRTRAEGEPLSERSPSTRSRYKNPTRAQAEATRRSKVAANRRHRALKAEGNRPIDIIRNVFLVHREAGKAGPIDLPSIARATGFSDRTDLSGPPAMPHDGRVKRLLGLTLTHLAKAGEIRKTRDGWIATRKLSAPANVNGASAP